MRRSFLTLVAALIPVAVATPAPCTLVGLQYVTDSYVATQTGAEQPEMPPSLGNGLGFLFRQGYVENFDSVTDQMMRWPMRVDHRRSLLDRVTCETFTELIGSIDGKPYALGTRLPVIRDVAAAEIAMIWATTGYRGFDAERYLRAAKSEDWSVIPLAQRDSRKVLETVAKAYLDALLLGKATVEPWGAPCSSCQVGLPEPAVNIANRHTVIDETLGAVAVFCTFGADPNSGRIRTPDVHLFRVEGGKVRYVHAITHLPNSVVSG